MRHYTIQPTALGTIVTGRLDICDRCSSHDDCTLCEYCDTVVCGDCEESRRLDGVYVCPRYACQRKSRRLTTTEDLHGRLPDEDQCQCGSRELSTFRPFLPSHVYHASDAEYVVWCAECDRTWTSVIDPTEWGAVYVDEEPPLL